MSLQQSLSVEQARELLLGIARPHGRVEPLPLERAACRVCAADVHAAMDQPPFDRSPLDGYALRHEDALSASPGEPAALRVVEHIFAGDAPQRALGPGECARVMTGAPLPQGSDCVVRQEDVRAQDGTVLVMRRLERHENYCFRGEDIAVGQTLVQRGDTLDPGRIGTLASQGVASVGVYERPRLGILSTGSELLPLGAAMLPGKIYDSNSYTLLARAQALGADCTRMSVPDDPAAIAAAIEKLLPGCDMLVTTGGASVGEHDYMPRVGELLGARKLFYGIKAKPGGLTLAFEKDGKALLFLSGNPFAAYAVFELLGVPALRAIAGCASVLPRRLSATLRGGFAKPSKGRRFLRAQFDGSEVTLPQSGHSSGSLSSLSGCNCLIDLPAGTPPLQDGQRVEVILFG